MKHSADTTSVRGVVLFGKVRFEKSPDGVEVFGNAPVYVAWQLQGYGCVPFSGRHVNGVLPIKIIPQTLPQLRSCGLRLDDRRHHSMVISR